MKENGWARLPFPAAKRDSAMFDDAGEFVIGREANRHGAFGLGIHRRPGPDLARLELKIAVEKFVKRLPKVELAGPTRCSVGQIRCPHELPNRVLDTA